MKRAYAQIMSYCSVDIIFGNKTNNELSYLELFVSFKLPKDIRILKFILTALKAFQN